MNFLPYIFIDFNLLNARYWILMYIYIPDIQYNI